MSIEKIMMIAQIIVSLLLMVSILLQNRGAGLGSTFGGDMAGYYTKRGMEKFLNAAAVILAVVFIGLSVAIIFFTSRAIV
jgi:protein translocase SecG subunit